MKNIAICTLVLLSTFLAAAEEPDAEIHWMIDKNGELMGSPNPELGDLSEYGERLFFAPIAKSSDLFSRDQPGQRIRSDFQLYYTGLWSLPFLFHGGLDLASIAD